MSKAGAQTENPQFFLCLAGQKKDAYYPDHLPGYAGMLICFRAKPCPPQATLVFDRFHIVQHLNQALNEIRRDQIRKVKGEERLQLKRTRIILLKNL